MSDGKESAELKTQRCLNVFPLQFKVGTVHWGGWEDEGGDGDEISLTEDEFKEFKALTCKKKRDLTFSLAVAKDVHVPTILGNVMEVIYWPHQWPVSFIKI